MEKSTFSFIVNGKRHVTKITEEKNPKALLNYLTVEQEKLSKRIQEWFKNPQTTLLYLPQEQKSLKERIEEWMKKVKHQKQVVKEYNEQEEITKMDKWMKEKESQQESFSKQGKSQINFLQTQEEEKIPEEVKHL